MHKQVEKRKRNKTGASVVAQKKEKVKRGFGFMDNRPNVILQKKMKEAEKAFFSEKNESLLSTVASHNTDQQKIIPTGHVVQRTVWEWDSHSNQWQPISEITSSPPSFRGMWHKQQYNDRVQPPSRIEYGGGNFSFADSYVKKHPTFAPSFTSTSYESKQVLDLTYPDQKDDIDTRIQHLEQEGGTVRHGINATQHNQQTDVTHFNFPHTGDIHTSKTSTMLKDFLQNMAQTQQDGHIIRMGVEGAGKTFDSRYGLRGALSKSTYHPIKKMAFNEKRFPGYSHVKTTGKGKFNFEEDSRSELWFQKTGLEGNSMDAIPNLPVDTSEDSDDERALVYKKRYGQENYSQQNPYDYHMRKLLEGRPAIDMRPLTLTDNIHTGAYYTFDGAKIKPTGRFEREHIEVEVLDSYDRRLAPGTTVFVKRKHIIKVGRY
ncbi:Rossmann-like fold-containing protein [Enterobacter asburiae]